MSKKISLLNYFKDSINFDKNRRIRKKLLGIKETKSNKYDYGCGYFYQSSDIIRLSGLRSSKKRVLSYSIKMIIANKDILDIGTNSGFLLFELENNYKSIVGIDYNSNLIELANTLKNYLDLKKIIFLNEDFNKYEFNKKFDVIFSLANHSPYDEGIKSTLSYLSKCNTLLKNGGFFLIEGHHPKHEKISDFCLLIENFIKKYNYDVKTKSKLFTNNFYDDGRQFYLLKKR